MARPDRSTRSLAERLGPHLRGHVLRFETRPAPAYDAATGLRLLLIVLLLEGILGPRLSLVRALGLPLPPDWARAPMLLAVALLLVRYFAHLSPVALGLYRWREWSTTEKSYFLQVLVLANVVFSVLYSGRLRTLLVEPGAWGSAALVSLTYLVWGFYQELVYRGMLQTELVRRWGTIAGILVSNALYTFGPLHFYHFSRLSGARAVAMFAGIFAIGLFFALVYRRSRNLWMVGVFHGVGDCYITGLTTLAR